MWSGAGDCAFPSGAPPVIPSNIWYVNVHTSPSDPAPVSCGNVAAHPASVLRFKPSTITIRTGDTVEWRMLDGREVHPLYFGPASGAPANPFSPPSGGNTIAAPTASVLSGPQFPGQSFRLTFTGPGTYSYLCTLHAEAGMVGTVVVQGAAITRPAPVSGTLARTGTSSGGSAVALAGALVLLGSLVLLGERRWRRAS